MSATASAQTLALRARVIAVLSACRPDPLPTSEICRRAGFTKFEQHSMVSPQLRRLARSGIVVRSDSGRGHEATWQLNMESDPRTVLLDQRQQARPRQPRYAPVREKQARAWESAYEALREFIAAHGHLPERGFLAADGRNLRSWIDNQQTAYNQGCMYPARARRLEELDCWTWSKSHDQAWDSAFEAVRQYEAQHGRPPGRGYVGADGRDLHSWMENQRGAYKRGRLRPDRARRLAELHWWRWAKAAGEVWEEAFQALQAYITAHGQLPPHTYTTAEGLELGRWVKKQIANHSQKRLSPENADRLEQIDVWTWTHSASLAEANNDRALRAATADAHRIAELGDLAAYNLPTHLQATAEMRREDPDLSLSALAILLGVSKDVCSSRLRRFWQQTGHTPRPARRNRRQDGSVSTKPPTNAQRKLLTQLVDRVSPKELPHNAVLFWVAWNYEAWSNRKPTQPVYASPAATD
ncbi:Helicase associated domain protein [Mycobacteroides abscessus]